jgi:hypothetical protein
MCYVHEWRVKNMCFLTQFLFVFISNAFTFNGWQRFHEYIDMSYRALNKHEVVYDSMPSQHSNMQNMYLFLKLISLYGLQEDSTQRHNLVLFFNDV